MTLTQEALGRLRDGEQLTSQRVPPFYPDVSVHRDGRAAPPKCVLHDLRSVEQLPVHVYVSCRSPNRAQATIDLKYSRPRLPPFSALPPVASLHTSFRALVNRVTFPQLSERECKGKLESNLNGKVPAVAKA